MASGSSLMTAAATVETNTKPDRDVAVEALNHLVQGKRHLLVHDIPSAVNSLEEACRLLDACYGQMADECGDAYYNYGVALLEMSRRETGVLGNGKDGSGSESGVDNSKDEDDDDDDDDEDDDKEDDDDDDDDDEEASGSGDDDSKTTEKKGCNADQVAPNKNANTVAAEGSPKAGDSDAKSENLEETEEADEGKEEVKNSEVPSTSVDFSSATTLPEATAGPALPEASSPPTPRYGSSSIDTAKPGSSSTTTLEDSKPGTSSTNNASNEDEEPSCLQLAWEVFEVAKIIFQRQAKNNPDMMLNLARVHSKLGEVSMESENYKQGIDDLLECLSMQRSLLPGTDRCIAETYYQLGLAYSFDLQFDTSINNFKNAIQVLKDRMNNLEKVVADSASETESSQKEINELNTLISEINDKIVDTDDLVKNALKLTEALAGVVPVNSGTTDLRKEQNNSLVAVDSTTSSAPVAAKAAFDIGHLIRKKRKTEDSEVNTSNVIAVETKRARTEVGETANNGHVTVSSDASSTNGIMSVDALHSEIINGCADSTAAST